MPGIGSPWWQWHVLHWRTLSYQIDLLISMLSLDIVERLASQTAPTPVTRNQIDQRGETHRLSNAFIRLQVILKSAPNIYEKGSLSWFCLSFSSRRAQKKNVTLSKTLHVEVQQEIFDNLPWHRDITTRRNLTHCAFQTAVGWRPWPLSWRPLQVGGHRY